MEAKQEKLDKAEVRRRNREEVKKGINVMDIDQRQSL